MSYEEYPTLVYGLEGVVRSYMLKRKEISIRNELTILPLCFST
jgi:hypothetical protein